MQILETLLSSERTDSISQYKQCPNMGLVVTRCRRIRWNMKLKSSMKIPQSSILGKGKISNSVLWQILLYPHEHKQSNATTQRRRLNVGYTTIADRLMKVGVSNNSQPTGVVKLVYARTTISLTQQQSNQKTHI